MMIVGEITCMSTTYSTSTSTHPHTHTHTHSTINHIIDVKIGFQRNYTVNETVGTVQVCTVVHSPSPSVPILSRIILGINTIAGTAGS